MNTKYLHYAYWILAAVFFILKLTSIINNKGMKSIQLNPDGTFPHRRYVSTDVIATTFTSTFVECTHHTGWFDSVIVKWLGIEWGRIQVYVCCVCHNIIQDKKTIKKLRG